MSTHVGRIAGPMLGAAIIGLLGTAAAFAVDGLSFLISAACLVPLARNPARPSRRPGAQAQSIARDIREGIGTVLQSPVLWISIAVFALINITLAGPYSVALPFLVRDRLRADVGTLGLLYAIFPIGYIAGGVGLGSLRAIRRRGFVAFGAVGLAGLMLAIFGLPVPLAGLALAALANGAALESGRTFCRRSSRASGSGAWPASTRWAHLPCCRSATR